MTYLEIVNAVLRRLREDQVTTVAESDYSQLIGDFVNDAKRLVEDAWDWTGLRNTTTITTVAGTDKYSLTGYGVRSKIIQVHNETNNRIVEQQALPFIRNLALQSDNATGTIQYWAIDGTDANGDSQIRFHMVPNAVETISVYGVKRTGDLSSDTDTVLIPTNPIIQWAYSYALRERGETGGQSAAEQAIFAKEDLTNAIAQDASLHPEETIWNV
jgi:hypothetical protein